MKTLDKKRLKMMEQDETVIKITEVISEIYGVSLEDMRTQCRQIYINYPRHLCMYLIREYTKYSLVHIGLYFRRHHASVLNAETKIKNGILYDKEIREEYNAAKTRFENYHTIKNRAEIFEDLVNDRVKDSGERRKWLNRYVVAN